MLKSELLLNLQQKLTIQNYSQQTIKSYMSAVRMFINYIVDKKIDDVDEKVIHNYLFMCKDEKNYSLSSMKQAYSALRFLYFQVLQKPFPQNINFYFRSEERLPEILSTEEVNRIFSKVNNLKHKAILMTIYSAGLRISELLNLKVREIDFDRNTIRISSAKGKKDRLVMLSQRLVPILKKYLEQYQPIEYLIEGQKGGIYSPSSVRQFFIKAISKARINKKVTVHTLRHSFATHLLDRGTDIRYIQELLGHKKLETTQIYTHISKNNVLKIKSPLDTL